MNGQKNNHKSTIRNNLDNILLSTEELVSKNKEEEKEEEKLEDTELSLPKLDGVALLIADPR